MKPTSKKNAIRRNFLIVLGILTLFGTGNAGNARAITLLLKVLPFLIFVEIFGVFSKNVIKKGYITLPFQQDFGYIYECEIPDPRQGSRRMA